jgi:hypothetical protein
MENTRRSLYHAATCMGSGKRGVGASLAPSSQSITWTKIHLSRELLSKALPCASNFCLSLSRRRSVYSCIPNALLLSEMVGVLNPRLGPLSAIYLTVGTTMSSFWALI